MDINSCRQNGSFLFIDGLTRFLRHETVGSFEASVTLNNPHLNFESNLTQQIDFILKNHIEFLDGPLCIIVDDLSILTILGIPQNDITDFIMALQNYCYMVIIFLLLDWGILCICRA